MKGWPVVTCVYDEIGYELTGFIAIVLAGIVERGRNATVHWFVTIVDCVFSIAYSGRVDVFRTEYDFEDSEIAYAQEHRHAWGSDDAHVETVAVDAGIRVVKVCSHVASQSREPQPPKSITKLARHQYVFFLPCVHHGTTSEMCQHVHCTCRTSTRIFFNVFEFSFFFLLCC